MKHISRVRSFCFVSALTIASICSLAVGPTGRAAVVEAVDAVGITVSDMDRSVAFYRDVLSFEEVSDIEVAGDAYEHLLGVFGLRLRMVRMRLGDEAITLIEYLVPRGRPIPVDSRSNDRWFQHIAIITPDMEGAYRHLRQHGVEHASTGPQRLPDWNPNAGGIKAFYFKDPDHNVLEVLEFPEGKGDPRWHRSQPDPGRLFLGIDHTAIVVGDTEASLAFYRDELGLAVAGGAENFGTEQEHLNNVFGARLRITTLKASHGGPGVELLEYLTPRDGRPMPLGTRANDLWHWQTRLRTADTEAAARRLRATQRAFVSPGVTTMPDDEFGLGRAVMVRDPDGHAMLLFEP
jgi:catechol 2,3-dioxygenase-like lactoylglutathione lyase family enzyme